MNYFLFILRSSLEDFARNKLRTMLTSLGILIGVLSVVLLISLGLGLKKYIQNQFDSLGANLLFITPGGSTGGGVGATVRFDERDITRLKRIKGVVYSVPLATANTSASFGGKEEKNLTLVSTTADFFPTRNIKAEYGRLFTKQDADKRSKVIVIGPKVADKLFGSPDIAIGQKITIQEQKMKIIGVTEKKGGGFGGGPDIDSYMYIPNKTGYSIVNPDRKIFAMNLKISNAEVLPAVKREVKKELAKRYDQDSFQILEPTDIISLINSIFGVLNGVLIAIAGISLVVGGIGIMNIMYVTITERIKEIGIRRAIGARKGDILYQFLLESTILSLFGGALGLLLAFLIVLGINIVFPAYIDATSVIVALSVSSIIGIVFGVFPAKKAADLSPMEAIRYE